MTLNVFITDMVTSLVVACSFFFFLIKEKFSNSSLNCINDYKSRVLFSVANSLEGYSVAAF